VDVAQMFELEVVMNFLAKTGTIWVVRGIASVIFGVLTLLRPGASIAALVFLYGAYAFVDGAFLLGYAFRREGPKAHYVISALLSIAAGAITFFFPGLTALSLYILIGAWAIATGVTELAIAAALRGTQLRVGGIVFAGLLSIACGIAFLALPLAGIVALVSLIAGYAIANGIFLIATGIWLHNFAREVPAV
jgi:uncharacterized membrane protein HdeD (DUF308 family)